MMVENVLQVLGGSIGAIGGLITIIKIIYERHLITKSKEESLNRVKSAVGDHIRDFIKSYQKGINKSNSIFEYMINIDIDLNRLQKNAIFKDIFDLFLYHSALIYEMIQIIRGFNYIKRDELTMKALESEPDLHQ